MSASGTDRLTISLIVPALNEVALMDRLLRNLLAAGADEVIVVDGGSTDGTAEAAERYPGVVVLRNEPSRALQMNRGAAVATGDVLLFLHADVQLAPGVAEAIRGALRRAEVIGGNLRIHFEGDDWIAALFDGGYNLRRHLGIFYGDSGIFCRRDVFQRLGGYRPYPVMEDYEFARRLFRSGPLAFLDATVTVSDRRWRREGIWKTWWNWVLIQAAYSLGVSPSRLGRLYRNIR